MSKRSLLDEAPAQAPAQSTTLKKAKADTEKIVVIMSTEDNSLTIYLVDCAVFAEEDLEKLLSCQGKGPWLEDWTERFESVLFEDGVRKKGVEWLSKPEQIDVLSRPEFIIRAVITVSGVY